MYTVHPLPGSEPTPTTSSNHALHHHARCLLLQQHKHAFHPGPHPQHTVDNHWVNDRWVNDQCSTRQRTYIPARRPDYISHLCFQQQRPYFCQHLGVVTGVIQTRLSRFVFAGYHQVSIIYLCFSVSSNASAWLAIPNPRTLLARLLHLDGAGGLAGDCH
jgi:hypothetical protein